MFSNLICGVSNLPEDHQDDEHDHQSWSSPGSTPRKSRTKNNFCSKRHKKNNPYAMRGLDKFSALLTELEQKKQKIYSQADSDDISFVRFVYSNSNECVPMVIRVKKKEKEIFTDKTMVEDDDVKDNEKKKKKNIYSEGLEEVHGEKNPDSESEKKSIENERWVTWRSIMRSHQWRWLGNHMPAALILILFFLALFGRSFAVLCTCFWWYIVPMIKGFSSNQRSKSKSTKKKKKVIGGGLQSSSPVKNITNSGKDDHDPNYYRSPRQHGHQKSW
ncbi:uncharacterized protein LOC110808450 [Carica papaya]|uniref:uncharacterized protein LOC110808450 n=1 Tax=Carica papaya TaxID=3649 RepID=UPI000B8CEBC9|nr:uncharacterized protein LOC110808450 [Carica papaya]